MSPTTMLLFVALLALLGQTSCQPYRVAEDDINYGEVYGHFGKDMLWATATASYQVEGGWNEDGKTPSIWDTESHVLPSVIKGNSTGDVACDSYHKWLFDVANLKAMGVNSYRFSISWNRIFPIATPGPINQAGVKYYMTLIDALKANNITPLITMYHWDLPQYLQDKEGLLSDDFADAFYYYADALFYTFGNKVQHWFTFNEPASFAIQGYYGFFAPAIPVCPHCPYIANRNLLLAHANAYRLYNRKYKGRQGGGVGIVLGINDQRPKTNSRRDVEAAERAMAWSAGVYLEPIFGSGNWPDIMLKVTKKRYDSVGQPNPLPKLHKAQQLHIQGTYDFLGVNIYTANLITDAVTPVLPASYYSDAMTTQSQDPSWPSSASPWLKFVPSAMPRVLQFVRRWDDQVALYITECGWSNYPEDSLLDRARIKFYRYYIGAALYTYNTLHANIKAFTAWSLMDNFEWRVGFTQRFGLYHTDFTSPQRTRTAKASVAFYSNTIDNNGFVRQGQTTTTTTTTTSVTPTTTTTTPTTSQTTSTSTTTASTTTSTTSGGGCVCPQSMLSGVSGHVSSPNYPLPYCNNLSCDYKLTVPPAYIIQARFLVNLEPMTMTQGRYIGDFLTIGESECLGVTALPLFGSTDRTFYTRDNHLRFSFSSNGTGEGQGWEMVWVALPQPIHHNSFVDNIIRPSPTVYGNHMTTFVEEGEEEDNVFDPSTDCGQLNHFGTHGVVQLPGYGHPYKNNMMCAYRIEVEPGFVIQARIIGSTDQSTASDGDGVTVLGNYCVFYLLAQASGKNFDVAFHSAGPSMGIVWRTDGRGVMGTGFIAIWKAVPQAPLPALPRPSISAPPTENCDCPPSQYGYVGIFESTNYPTAYCNRQSCTFHMVTAVNMTLKLHMWGNTWEDFDVLTVMGAPDGTITLSGYFDHTSLMTANEATVLFTSDDRAVKPGFRGFYQPCVASSSGTVCFLDDAEVRRSVTEGIEIDEMQVEEWVDRVQNDM